MLQCLKVGLFIFTHYSGLLCSGKFQELFGRYFLPTTFSLLCLWNSHSSEAGVLGPILNFSLCDFPKAVVRNDHKLGDLKQFSFSPSWRPEVRDQGVTRASQPREALGETLFPTSASFQTAPLSLRSVATLPSLL